MICVFFEEKCLVLVGFMKESIWRSDSLSLFLKKYSTTQSSFFFKPKNHTTSLFHQQPPPQHAVIQNERKSSSIYQTNFTLSLWLLFYFFSLLSREMFRYFRIFMYVLQYGLYQQKISLAALFFTPCDFLKSWVFFFFAILLCFLYFFGIFGVTCSDLLIGG